MFVFILVLLLMCFGEERWSKNVVLSVLGYQLEEILAPHSERREPRLPVIGSYS